MLIAEAQCHTQLGIEPTTNRRCFIALQRRYLCLIIFGLITININSFGYPYITVANIKSEGAHLNIYVSSAYIKVSGN